MWLVSGVQYPSVVLCVFCNFSRYGFSVLVSYSFSRIRKLCFA